MPNFTELIQKIMAMPFTIQPTDIAEMLIIAYVIYHLLVWVKNTRTWFLLKGIVVILLFFGVALLFEFKYDSVHCAEFAEYYYHGTCSCIPAGAS